jgi:hypothetical protein
VVWLLVCSKCEACGRGSWFGYMGKTCELWLVSGYRGKTYELVALGYRE